jgi:hypothetical protein
MLRRLDRRVAATRLSRSPETTTTPNCRWRWSPRSPHLVGHQLRRLDRGVAADGGDGWRPDGSARRTSATQIRAIGARLVPLPRRSRAPQSGAGAESYGTCDRCGRGRAAVALPTIRSRGKTAQLVRTHRSRASAPTNIDAASGARYWRTPRPLKLPIRAGLGDTPSLETVVPLLITAVVAAGCGFLGADLFLRAQMDRTLQGPRPQLRSEASSPVHPPAPATWAARTTPRPGC